MLLAIELENFFSIKNKIRLDFRAGNINTNQAKMLKDNLIEWNGQKNPEDHRSLWTERFG